MVLELLMVISKTSLCLISKDTQVGQRVFSRNKMTTQRKKSLRKAKMNNLKISLKMNKMRNCISNLN